MLNNIRNNNSLNNFENLIKHVNSLPMNEVAEKLGLDLNKVGTSYKGNCPSGHPSSGGNCFSINTDTGGDDNYFHCFSCGVGGKSIELVKIKLGLTFIEAVMWLVNAFKIRHSVQFSNGQFEEKNEEKLRKENEFRLKAELYEEILKWGHSELFTEKAKEELEYLTAKRGYDIEVLKNTEFCYFPAQKEIREYLLGIYPEGIKLIRSLSLNGYYGDNFRIAFPYRNRFGQITGFLKRATEPKGIKVTTKDGKTHGNIRWDSTYGLSKRDLYNLNNIKNQDTVLIVEGYPDTLYLSALGVDNITAVGAGRLSKSHLDGLNAKKIKKVIFALDNDEVGPENTAAAVKMMLKESNIIPFVIDPDILKPYKDPDEFVKGKGLDEFKEIVDRAVKGSGWIMDRIIKAGNERDLLKAKAKEELLALSLILNDPEDISQLAEKISEFLNLSKNDVKNLIKKARTDYKPRKAQGTEGLFWKFDYDENNEPELKVSMIDYVDFLTTESFAKHYLGRDYIFLNDRNNLVQEFSMPQIKDHVLKHIDGLSEKENPHKREVFEHLYRNVGMYFNEGLIECIPPKKITFKRDEPEKAFVYFRNGFVTLQKGKTTKFHGYEELAHPIWKDSIIQRDFIKQGEENSKSCEFEQFIKNVSGNNSQRFQSLSSALGYMMHDYKDKANTKAVILCDEKLSDSSSANGRTGKSLVGKALSYMKNSLRIDARNFMFKPQFTFQLVKLDTRIIDFNDAEGDFEFEKLFSVITDDMTIEYKNKQPFTIPFEESPKILISTNYTIKGTGSSYRDRMFEIEFSDYYSDARKPIDEFHHRLFDDWDEDEWMRFDNFMLECLQLYLDKGLIKTKEINLSKRKLIDSTSADFVEFAESLLVLNNEYDLNTLFEEFKKYIGFEFDTWGKCPIKQNTFSKWLKVYADSTNLKFIKRQSNGKQLVTIYGLSKK